MLIHFQTRSGRQVRIRPEVVAMIVEADVDENGERQGWIVILMNGQSWDVTEQTADEITEALELGVTNSGDDWKLGKESDA